MTSSEGSGKRADGTETNPAAKVQMNVYLPPALVRRVKHRAIDEESSLSGLVGRLWASTYNDTESQTDERTEVARATVLVRPMRFTAHLSAMQEFLGLLGYSTRLSRDHRWATMVGVSGEVGLHDTAVSASGAPSGTTDLMFEVDKAETLALQFAQAGFDQVDIYDEAWVACCW